MLLDGVVEGGLALDVLRVDVGAVDQEELAQLHRLDRVDEAGAAVVVGPLDVCVVRHQQADNVQVRHEAGRPDRRGAGVRDGVDVGAVPHQRVHHLELSGDGGAPERGHVVHRVVVGHLVLAPLLHVGAAHGDEVLHDLHVALLAGHEERGAAVADHGADTVSGGAVEPLQPASQGVGEVRAGGGAADLLVQLLEEGLLLGGLGGGAA